MTARITHGVDSCVRTGPVERAGDVFDPTTRTVSDRADLASVAHPHVNSISFVGSTPIAKFIRGTGSKYGNGSASFTNDGGAARRFQNEVQWT